MNDRAWCTDAQDASDEVRELSMQVGQMVAAELPPMGLAAGGRPAADVDVLLGTVASVEYELARRLHAAHAAGSLPFPDAHGMAAARHWSIGYAKRLARAGAFAARWPAIAAPWAAGRITSEHVDVVARHAAALTDAHIAAVLEQLETRWGRHSPTALHRFLTRVVRMLAPPPDPEPDELDAYANRALSFALLGDSVVLSGVLPRLEGEAVMHAVTAWAERLRCAEDRVPAAARRADGLVALVNSAAGALPTRGGLPVALSVTLDHTPAGDAVWTTSTGQALTRSEQRFTACTAEVTPIVVARPGDCEGPTSPVGNGAGGHAAGPSGTSARIAGLAATLLDHAIPLAVGRTSRSATAGQRRALAVRDRGCVMPGCDVPPEQCQSHHLHEWSAGGPTDLANLVSLCWAHHRQVDLGMWRIEPTTRALPTEEVAPGITWSANHDAPWIIRAAPRTWWRL
jgi:hypothetical protein